MKAASQFDVDTEPFDSESDSESDCKGYRQRRRRDSFIFYSRQYDGRYIRYYSGGFLIAIAVVVNLIFTIFTLAFSIKSKFKLYIHV